MSNLISSGSADDARYGEKQTVMLTPSTDRAEYMAELLGALAATRRVFVNDDRVYLEHGGCLKSIEGDSQMSQVMGQLVNVLKQEGAGKATAKTIIPPASEGGYVLRNPGAKAMLPQVRYVSRVPVFDDAYEIVSPGYNATSRIFYEGPRIEPASDTRHLDMLLDTICFQRRADRTSYLAHLLTPFMGPRFRGGRPMGLFVGNQPSIGKTDAAECLAVLHQGDSQVRSVTYNTNDLEFEKQIAAVIRQCMFVLVDNVNVPVVRSGSVERTLTASSYNFRQVGTSNSISGANYLQFAMTLNFGVLSRDLWTRSVLVRFQFDGETAKRSLPTIGVPSAFMREHRNEIVAELLGMASRWIDDGHPLVPVPCRFAAWAKVANGILRTNSHDDFLSTYLADASQGDEMVSALHELAEAKPGQALRPIDWLAEAQVRQLLAGELKGRSIRACATIMGTILANNVGREFTVQPAGQSESEVFELVIREDRNGRRYKFVPKESAATTSNPAPALEAVTAA